MPVLPGPSRTQWKICADKKTSAGTSPCYPSALLIL